jgi:hypothetical protein
MPRFIKVSDSNARAERRETWVNPGAITRLVKTPNGTLIYFGGFTGGATRNSAFGDTADFRDFVLAQETVKDILQEIEARANADA